MATNLHIQLLGDFRLLYGETPVPGVDTTRMQSFLAYLLFHRNAPQSRSHLAFLFWPDSTEAQARTNLRKQIYHLRHALPDADLYLETGSKTVQWRPDAPFTLDVAQFDAALSEAKDAERSGDEARQRATLERAMDLYRGDLLPSCYDDWLVVEQEHLRQALTGAAEKLVLLLEVQRDYAAAIQAAQRFLRHDPLHEDTYRRLMRFYALTGKRAQALRTYHTCATVLQRELGVEPDAATRAAHLQLVRMDSTPVRLGDPEPRAQASAVVGRGEEWGQIQTAWREAAKGQPQLVVLSGEAGIGKTRLAEEVLLWAARQGTATASARSYASNSELAYAPLTDWLRSEGMQSGLLDLDPVWLTEVARLLPELLAQQPGLAPPGPLAESWQKQRLYQALARAFATQRQLVLFLDDMQWCDGETLAWLPHVLRPQQIPDSAGSGYIQLLVLATVRSDELAPTSPAASLMHDLQRDRLVTEIKLDRLDEADVAVLVANVAGSPLDAELVADLYRETEGNPLFVVETVEAGLFGAGPGSEQGRMHHGWPLPPAVQEAISARLAQLSPAARELVNVASVTGRAFTFEVLAHASNSGAGGAGEEELVCALDELWLRHIVREQGTAAYDFSHDKIREVAYAGLSAVRRQNLHRRVAQAMETVHAGDLDALHGQIAAHYEKAGLLEPAIPHYLRAATVARRVYANREAIGYLQHVLNGHMIEMLTAEEACDVCLDLGRVLQHTGAWTEAEAVYRQALAHAQESASRQAQARCEHALGDVLRLQGHYNTALEYLGQAQEDLGAVGDTRGVMDVLWTMGEIYWYKGDYNRALAALELQAEIAAGLGDERSMSDAAGSLGIICCSMGDSRRAEEYCWRSMETAERIGHEWAVGRAAITLGNVESGKNNHRQALEWYAKALETTNRIGDQQGLGWVVANMALLYVTRGDYARAQRCDQFSLYNALEIGDKWTISICLSNMAEYMAKMEQNERAEMLYQKAIALGRALDLNFLPSYLVYLAEFYAGQHRLREARELNDEALALAAHTGVEQMGGDDILFKARILELRMRLELGEIMLADAVAGLEANLDSAQDEDQKARLIYELWRLEPGQESRRQAAARGYRDLYERIPNLEYSQRFLELTGRPLPPPPPLPDLPVIVQQNDLDLEPLLAEVDRVIAGLGQVCPQLDLVGADRR